MMSELTIADLFGILAALCMLSAFNCKNLIALRCISLSASVFFILYAWAMNLLPILILHGILLPLNALRLLDCLKSKGAGGSHLEGKHHQLIETHSRSGQP